MDDSPQNQAGASGADAGTTAVADRGNGPPRKGNGRGPGGGGRGGRGGSGPSPAGGSRLAVYKRGQGQYTRWGTFLGSGVLIAAGGHFLYNQLSVYRDESNPLTIALQLIIPLLVVVALMLAVYWVSFVNRRACDFMIATEGEMKKVNWSSRREIVGSTKVVILFTVLLAVILFVVDMIFMTFFAWINVLREAPSLWQMLFGSGS